MTVHVRKLAPEPASTADIEEAAQWLIESFATDPIMPPSLGGDMELSVNLWRGFMRAGMAGGEVYVAGLDSQTSVDGVAVWFPPGTDFLESPEQLAAWDEMFGKYLNADGRHFWEHSYEETCGAVIGRVLAPDEHKSMWHLQLIGTRVSAQRQGVARALVEHIGLKAKDTGMRLETFTDLNVTVYERLGFVNEGANTLTSPQGNVTISCMFKWPDSKKSPAQVAG